ncbi:MAG: GDP-mannose 4,6-dehydratase [Candidatus Altiarchaeota archaeon]
MDDRFWRDRNVFVTGCTGFLGSWLTKALVDRGANVTGLIRDWIPKSNLVLTGYNEKVSVVRGAVEDYPLLERTLNEYEIDTVFHLAAQTIVTIANRGPLSTFETNIKGSWSLLEASRRAPLVRRIICASSDKAYGNQIRLPYSEDTPLEGRHPYDVSKSCEDLIARSYFETYGLPVCVTRCGNFFGGGDLNFNRIVPGTIRSVNYGERPLIRSDGKSTRDYIYIEDAVEAYMLLAERMGDKKIHGEALNFSNEKPMTVKGLVERIIKIMGSDLRPVILDEASNEIRHQYLSSKKARKILNWKPHYDFEAGMKRTIEWYVGFLNDGVVIGEKH